MIIIEYDYYLFLKSKNINFFNNEKDKFNKVKNIHLFIPEHAKNIDFDDRQMTIHLLSKKPNLALNEFALFSHEIIEKIKQENIKEVTFFTFPLLWLIFYHDLINLEVKCILSSLRPTSFLPKVLTHTLLPFAYEHAHLYFNNQTEDKTLNIKEHFLALKNGVSTSWNSAFLNKASSETEIIILSNIKENHFSLSSTKNQDISFYLYKPLLKNHSFFLIKKTLFNSLTKEELTLLKSNPNYFLYMKNINIAVLLVHDFIFTQTDFMESLTPSLTSSFEEAFFYETSKLYSLTMDKK